MDIIDDWKPDFKDGMMVADSFIENDGKEQIQIFTAEHVEEDPRFVSSVELIQAMAYKLKRDTNQNFEKFTYNFKMRETWNNTCASTTLNTRKKIVKIEIITMVITQNVMRTKIYIHIYKINLKNNTRTRELSQHVSAAYLKWDSPI